MSDFHTSLYSHYFDDDNKLVVVYFNIKELEYDERGEFFPTDIILQSIVKIHNDSRDVVYFIVKNDRWVIAFRDPDDKRSLVAIGAPDRFRQWIVQVSVFEYEKYIKEKTPVEGTSIGFADAGAQ